jgi:hypothetical protein
MLWDEILSKNYHKYSDTVITISEAYRRSPSRYDWCLRTRRLGHFPEENIYDIEQFYSSIYFLCWPRDFKTISCSELKLSIKYLMASFPFIIEN